MQARLLKSVRGAIKLDASQIFNSILTDKGLQRFILDLNRSQLFVGEDSLGVKLEKIGGGYSFTTEFLNEGLTFTYNPKSKGVEGGTKSKIAGQSPFLLQTGDYYASYTLILGPDFVRIDSDPQKADNNLEDAYGDNLEGLQDKNLNKIITIIREGFIAATRLQVSA